MPISTVDMGIFLSPIDLNTKTRLTMLCLSGFELYSRWVPLLREKINGNFNSLGEEFDSGFKEMV